MIMRDKEYESGIFVAYLLIQKKKKVCVFLSSHFKEAWPHAKQVQENTLCRGG